MKLHIKLFQQTILSILFFLPSAAIFAAADTYVLDPFHSYVAFRISHFGFSNPTGKWLANGTLVLDEKNPENSKVDVSVKIAKVITGIPELDKHLQAPLFFDSKKFPTATFVSNKITMTGKDSADIEGMMTIHGISKPLTLHATLNKYGESPITKKLTAGFSATAELNRSDFGMNALLPGLGDKVYLTIEVEAAKK